MGRGLVADLLGARGVWQQYPYKCLLYAGSGPILTRVIGDPHVCPEAPPDVAIHLLD